MIISTKKTDYDRADFYIARIGSDVGKPMKTRYTSNNSFAVLNGSENDFKRISVLYHAKIFEFYAHGSCQPVIRKRDVEKLIKATEVITTNFDDVLELVERIQTLESITQKLKSKLPKLANSKIKDLKL